MAFIMFAVAETTVIALSLFASVNSLDIEVQPQSVRPGDENVMFSCIGGNISHTLSKIFRMTLLKLDEYDKWTEVAVLNMDGSTSTVDGNATADGRLGDVRDSFLKVNWPIAPDDINGRYRCNAVALTWKGDLVKEKSRDLDVKSLSRDVSFLLERLRKTEKKLVTRVNETTYGAMKASERNLLSLLDSNFGDLKEYLANKTAASKREPEKKNEIMNWPGGEFTLLMPIAGCPLHPPAWIKGFKKMEANAGNKYYPMSTPVQLAIPHKKDGFIYRQFCTLPALEENTEPWPAGSYCLYTMAKLTCPSGFKYAETKVKILSQKGNFYLYFVPKKYTGTFKASISRFCCRHDGKASNPIDLPVSHPFYLFRHGGRCQEVKGMDVIQDIFMMETVEDADYDKWIDNNPDFHPDVTFQPYKEDLCYYSKHKV